jgi:hypothetical protein
MMQPNQKEEPDAFLQMARDDGYHGRRHGETLRAVQAEAAIRYGNDGRDAAARGWHEADLDARTNEGWVKSRAYTSDNLPRNEMHAFNRRGEWVVYGRVAKHKGAD